MSTESLEKPHLSPSQEKLFTASHEVIETPEMAVIELRDPFTGEAMHSSEIPGSIRQIEHLQNGVQYLQERAHDMHLTLFASRHGDEVVHTAEELDPLLEGHDAYFLEGFGTVAERREIHRRAATVELSEDDWANYRTVPSPYTDRQLAAIAGRGTPIFMPEIPRDGSAEENALLEYSTIMNEFWPYAFGDDQEATMNLLVAQAGSNVIREWYMLANMGSQLAQHEQETGQKITKPLLWMGGGHEQSLRAKAQTLGVELSVERSQYDREQALGDDDVTQAIGAMAVHGALRLR